MALRKTLWLPTRSHHVSVARSIRSSLILVFVAMLTITGTNSVVAKQQSEAETKTGETRSQQAAAVEVHISQCEPGYSVSDIFDDCHGNGLPGVPVTLTPASGDGEDKTTTQVQASGPGVVQFGNLSAGAYDISIQPPDEGQRFVTYCSLAESDQVVPMAPGNASEGRIEVADGQTVICDFTVIPARDDSVTGPSSDEAMISLAPRMCPQDIDPQAAFDVLVGACTAPLENVTFTLGDGSVSIETLNSSAAIDDSVTFESVVPGTYTLYSDVPLTSATERLFCVADDSNRYEKEFSERGVTMFTDVEREQIDCQWFVIPVSAAASTPTPQQLATQDPIVTPTPVSQQAGLGVAAVTPSPSPTGGNQSDADAVRGVESGGSLVVHLASCPAGYDGTEIFDTCHGTGSADQVFTLSGPEGSVERTTTGPHSPGPGIVDFTGLAAGDYQLAGGPPGDFGRLELYCSTQPDGGELPTSLDSTVASFSIANGEDVHCDWYFIPEDAVGETPAPTPTAEPARRAEILITLFACEPGASFTGASHADLAASCTEPEDGVEFTLGDVSAPPLSASTGISGTGAVRFYELLSGNYVLQPSLPAGLTSAALFCRIDKGERYQKTLTNGSTTFVDLDDEAIACDWFATQAEPQPQPSPPGLSGSITVREFLCGEDQSEITSWERQCAAGSSGSTFALASLDGSLTRDDESAASGVLTFSDLPDGFFTLKQQDGMWCKARAERVDSQSRVIVEGGQNTDVFLYHCSAVTKLPSTGSGPAIDQMDGDTHGSGPVAMQLAMMGGGVLVAAGLIVLNRRRRETTSP